MFVLSWETVGYATEPGALVLPTLEDALEKATRMRRDFGGESLALRLFRVGEELPLAVREVERRHVERRVVLAEEAKGGGQ